MSGFLPYFKPLYPAVTFRCQLCGKVLSSGEYITQPARTAEARMAGGGDYSFCADCAPHLSEITQKLGWEAERLDAEHEKTKQERLRTLAEGYMESLQEKALGGHAAPPQGDALAPPPQRSPRRRGPTSIPLPN